MFDNNVNLCVCRVGVPSHRTPHCKVTTILINQQIKEALYSLICTNFLPQTGNYHNAILPAAPKSRVAVAMPNAWTTSAIAAIATIAANISKSHKNTLS